MSAYNFRMHDAVVAAIGEAIESEVENLLNDRNADVGGYRFRIGRINGMQEALAVAEATRQKHLEG